MSRDTVEQEFALKRQLFLCEQGYSYAIRIARDLEPVHGEAAHGGRGEAGQGEAVPASRRAMKLFPCDWPGFLEELARWGELSIEARRAFLDGTAPGLSVDPAAGGAAVAELRDAGLLESAGRGDLSGWRGGAGPCTR